MPSNTSAQSFEDKLRLRTHCCLFFDFNKACANDLETAKKIAKAKKIENGFLGRKDGLRSSYVIIEGQVMARRDFINNGSYGSVKHSPDKRVIKTIKFMNNDPMTAIEQEALLNYQNNISDFPKPVIRHKNNSPYKGYIIQKFLGENLSVHLDKNKHKPSIYKFDLCIQLLTQVKSFHEHVQYRDTKLGFTHGDIKPHNIMINEQQQLQVIDFGCSRQDNLDDPHKQKDGTPAYMHRQYSPDYYFDDKIASFASILNPNDYPCILSADEFQQLPRPLQNLLNVESHHIRYQIKNNHKYTIQAALACFIVLKSEKKSPSDRSIKKIIQSKSKQLNIIDAYQAKETPLEIKEYNDKIFEQQQYYLQQHPMAFLKAIPFLHQLDKNYDKFIVLLEHSLKHKPLVLRKILYGLTQKAYGLDDPMLGLYTYIQKRLHKNASTKELFELLLLSLEFKDPKNSANDTKIQSRVVEIIRTQQGFWALFFKPKNSRLEKIVSDLKLSRCLPNN